jgi:hypothetical protein
MQCFDVSINGKHVCRAGTPHGHNLSVDVLWSDHWQMPFVTVSGNLGAYGEGERLEWGTQQLKVGDEVIVRVTEAEVADEPLKRQKLDYSEEIKRRLSEDAELPPYCSFCGKALDEVGAMISGPKVFICDECVRVCVNIWNERPSTPPSDRLEMKEGEVLKGRWPEQKKNDS